jgi:hypothetical protein
MRGLKGILFIIGWFITFTMSFAQLPENSPKNILEIAWANDFVFMTDRYFSDGLEFNFYNPAISKLPIRHILLPSQNADYSWQGVTLVQNFYTPDDLKTTEVVKDDRPYASYLMLGQRKISLYQSKLIKIQSEFKIGLLGKFSGGETIQNGIHIILPPSEPANGWHNQINSDLAINYFAEIEKGIVHNNAFELNVIATAAFGVPYTQMEGGFNFRAGRFLDYFASTGISNQNDYQLYFFADFRSQFKIYDGTIQGGLFNKPSIHVLDNITHWIAMAKGGVTFSVKNFKFDLGAQYITPEFSGGRSHAWGFLKFSFGF